ncbi:uncharacterized protein LOC132541424 isoform X2 [Erinaceus europaeus]|uniref:Uncharacterized protein LOC132541424 isoform X2 n=1 Tax=Erinaceus europaeus TaxID=9365 RepID=A0ABM3YAL0_ERIEU|nr:uncharacterized protein LOC132541424 isoform X2 [Erinaceus europaeus]XP_060058110.1 uncharacterized protein LOC132541424 isoform X2 [Erinaceus europaeus]
MEERQQEPKSWQREPSHCLSLLGRPVLCSPSCARRGGQGAGTRRPPHRPSRALSAPPGSRPATSPLPVRAGRGRLSWAGGQGGTAPRDPGAPSKAETWTLLLKTLVSSRICQVQSSFGKASRAVGGKPTMWLTPAGHSQVFALQLLPLLSPRPLRVPGRAGRARQRRSAVLGRAKEPPAGQTPQERLPLPLPSPRGRGPAGGHYYSPGTLYAGGLFKETENITTTTTTTTTKKKTNHAPKPTLISSIGQRFKLCHENDLLSLKPA